MNEILVDTHRQENIEFLKARDYYFNKAKKYNKWKNAITQLPAYMLVLSYMVLLASYVIQKYFNVKIFDDVNRFCEKPLEYVIGIVTIVSFVVALCLNRVVSKNKDISNMLREEYDLRVFKMKRNIFAYGDVKEKKDEYLKEAKYVKDYYKYEVWYGEIFSDEREKNVLCCQMDNIIYTYYLYGDMKKIYFAKLFLCAAVMFLAVLASGVFKLVHPFLVGVAFFDLIKTIIEEISVCSEMKSKNMELKKVVEDDGFYKKMHVDIELTLRCLQDCVMYNRDNSLFAPKIIRDKYLKEGNEYYKELDNIKKRILGNDCTMPENEDELSILSMDETKQVKMRELQDRLYKMLSEVVKEFDENNITYTLDGGTLIGAVRKNKSGILTKEKLPKKKWDKYIRYKGGKFLFWDDDVDLAIPIHNIEEAKKIIREKFANIYVVQDCDNELYYSPRLSNFRIRELNERSRVAEKDSVLWEKYNAQGIFIDIYAYTPILYNIVIDKIYRRLCIHPLNKKIKKVEDSCKHSDFEKKAEKRFIKLKALYMKRISWYIEHAKNDKYYSYAPNFINDIKKSGPYFKKESLYGQKKFAEFREGRFNVPSEPAHILAKCYGEEWYKSPFSSKSELMKESSKWFSMVKHMSSVSKHIKQVDLY